MTDISEERHQSILLGCRYLSIQG